MKGENNMTFYQELQLNQTGSKKLISSLETKKEKFQHTLIYLFKIFLNILFCMTFVISYNILFGNSNSIVGVLVLLCVLVFRNVDFSYKPSHAILSMFIIFVIFAIGPRLANIWNPFAGCIINVGFIFIMMIIGCHNPIMFNHSTLVLGYLLLYGYDVTGQDYLNRIYALILGFLLTSLVYIRNHHMKKYNEGIPEIIRVFDLQTDISRWQLGLAIGVSLIICILELLGFSKSIWAGIATLSVISPNKADTLTRTKDRIWGNLLGAFIFFIFYHTLPNFLYDNIGIIGGIGVGLSATYGWQAVFNTLSTLSTATDMFGLSAAIFLRTINNIIGSIYGSVFRHIVKI